MAQCQVKAPLRSYKPDSVHPCGLCGHFSHSSEKPCPAERQGATRTRGSLAGRRPSPCLSCIARGLPCPRRCLRGGGLLPHLFTLTLAGGLFSVALSVSPACAENPSLSRGALPCDVRTFLYCGAPAAAATRTRAAPPPRVHDFSPPDKPFFASCR